MMTAVRRLAAICEPLPLIVPAGLAAFSTVAVFFLLLGQFKGQYVWTLGLAAAILAALAVFRYGNIDRPGSTPERRVCDLLAILGITLWLLINIFFTAQHVLTNRDPATYANAAAWLTSHDSINIDIPDTWRDIPGVHARSAGFGIDKLPTPHIYAQGLHLLPALLGLGGRVVGEVNMLHLNVIFGSTTLLAVYGFARLLGRPRWALLITAALAASMPFLYFSRDTYTEPLAATFTFGALALLWTAQKQGRLALWFLAGLVAGAGTMTRIDGYLTITALVLFLAVWLAIANKKERLTRAKQAVIMSSGMAVTGLLGWLDVSRLSRPYYNSLKHHFNPEILLLFLATAFGVLAVWLSWKTGLLNKLDKATKHWRAPATAVFVVVVILILASMPLWHHEYRRSGARSFGELAIYWPQWYIGSLLAILGFSGFVVAVYRAVKRNARANPFLVASLLVVGLTALVYFIKPRIAPDHIWASRRLVPVILPGIAAFAVVALDWLDKKYFLRAGRDNVITALMAIIIIAAPLVTSRPLLASRVTTELAPIADTCDALPENAVVLWRGQARLEAVMPTRNYCGVPAYGFHLRKTQAAVNKTEVFKQMAAKAEQAGGTAVIGLYGSQAGVYLSKDQRKNMTKVSSYGYLQLSKSKTAPPDHVVTKADSIQLGIINKDGTIGPLN